jgi:hypothetical protein
MERYYEPNVRYLKIGGLAMTRSSMQYIPLSSAYLCPDCGCVGNCAEQCPACASTVLMTLAGVLDREVEAEVEQQPALVYCRAAA